MADSVLTNYTQSGPVVANGTVGTTINSIIIRSPADQRTALNVYSTEQANMLFLPVSAPPGSSATMTSNINMSGNAITNLKAPLTTSDAANKAYVDSTTVSLAGDTMTGPLQMNNNAVTGLPAPQNSTDAASKNYVDTKFMVAAGPNNVTGVMQMNNNIIAGLPAPQNAGDAANKNYVDTTTVSLAGDTMTGPLQMNNNRITDLPNVPAASTDAVNKTYVDAAVAAGVASVSSGPGYLPLTGTGNNMLTGAINMGGNLINAVLAPVVATDAANKAYVDAQDAANKVYADTQDAAKLSLSGSLPMTGALNMGTKLINNLATPLAATDAATKAYADAQDALKLSLTGGTMSGVLNMGVRNITNVATPSAATDAATKSYVDTTAAGYVPLSGGTLTNAALAGASSTITGTLTCSGAGKITGVPTPSAASDAVPKSYADLLVAGLTFKPAVACYTTLATPFTSFVYNGGQQITINIVATPIDGYTLQLNDRVLVNCAGTQAANGVYLVTQLASPITLVRPTDLDGSPLSEFQQGGLFYVTNGTVFGGSLFVQSSVSPSVIGTSAIVYSQYAAAKNIAAGPNVAITGNQVAVASTLTGITSMALSAGDGSAGVVTVGKASGAASYTLALPAAAPAANTYLQYTGTNYAWSAASGSGAVAGASGTTPAQYYMTIQPTTVPVTLGQLIPFSTTQMVFSPGTPISQISTTQFQLLLPGCTYKLTATLPWCDAEVEYRWYDNTNSTALGVTGSSTNAASPMSVTAFAYVKPTTIINVGLIVTVVGSGSTTNANSDYSGTGRAPWATLEVVNSSTSYYMTTQTAAQTATPSQLFPFLMSPMIYTGTAITQPSTTQFQLLVGYTYKLTAALMYSSSGNTVYRWYDNTNSTALGVSGSNSKTAATNGTAVAYITPTATITVGLMIQSSAAVNLAASVGGLDGRMSWAAIEVVNSNTSYYMTTQTAAQNTSLNLIVPFLTTPMSSSAGTNITQSSATQFQLLSGYTYKLTSALNYSSPYEVCFQWYDITNSKKLGAATTTGNAGVPHNGTAIAYVTPSVTINVGIIVTANNSTIAASTSDGRMSWVLIEMLGSFSSLPLVGANSANYGSLGLVPSTGQENYYLSAAGGWAKLGLGLTGEKWNNVSTYRVAGTTYTNTNSYPISVSVICTTSSGSTASQAALSINGIVINIGQSNSVNIVCTLTGNVPPGQTYKVAVVNGAVMNTWVELY